MNRMIAVAALALVAVGCRSKKDETPPPPPAGLTLDGVWRGTVQGRAKVMVLRSAPTAGSSGSSQATR